MDCVYPQILCFGRDPLLLNTRRKILERAGFMVGATTDDLTVATCLLDGNVGVLILCHTLAPADLAVITNFHREMRSRARILYLLRGDLDPISEDCFVFKAQKGPAAFLATVTQLNSPSNLYA